MQVADADLAKEAEEERTETVDPGLATKGLTADWAKLESSEKGVKMGRRSDRTRKDLADSWLW